VIRREMVAIDKLFGKDWIRERKDGRVEALVNCAICSRQFRHIFYHPDEPGGRELEVPYLKKNDVEKTGEEVIIIIDYAPGGVCDRCYLNYKNRPREERMNVQLKAYLLRRKDNKK
jgi:hypothetical protein